MAATLLLLTACGEDEENVAADVYCEEGFAYSFAELPQPGAVPGWPEYICKDDHVYYAVSGGPPEARIIDLYYSALGSDTATELGAYLADLFHGCVMDDGTLLGCFENYDSEEITLLHIDAGGGILLNKRLDCLSVPENCISKYISYDNEGRIYIMFGGIKAFLCVLDSGGDRLLFSLDVKNAADMARTSSGEIAIGQPARGEYDGAPDDPDTYSGYLIRLVDADAGTWGESRELLGVYSGLADGADYELYLHEPENMFGYDFSGNKLTRLINWLDNGIELSSRHCVLGGGRFISLITYPGEQSKYCLMTRGTEPAAEPVTLKLATMNGDAFRGDVAAFNKASESVKIELLDYSEINGEGADAGRLRLAAEMLSGYMPDIIDLASFDSRAYISKNLLEDLYPFLTGDAGIDMDDFWPNVLKALEYEGALYELVPGFSIAAAMVRQSDGDETVWTAESFKALLANGAGYTSLFGSDVSRSEFLSLMVMYNSGSLLDRESGQAFFDTAGFVEMLSLSAALPAESEPQSFGEELFLGRQAALMTTVMQPVDLDMIRAYFRQD
ncbi:MAG: hypothetical protein Q4B42_07450, partial [Oscillospiraceae bacterium]|nr:hypothetical protein [Oscillospiraceae bacterium]